MQALELRCFLCNFSQGRKTEFHCGELWSLRPAFVVLVNAVVIGVSLDFNQDESWLK